MRGRPLLALLAILAAVLNGQASRPASRAQSAAVATARATVIAADRDAGPDSLEAVRARRVLAAALANDGQLDAAVEADRQALAILLASGSAKPNHIATTRGEIAALLYRGNRVEEARAVCVEAIAAAEALRVRDRLTARLFYVRAGAEIEMGRLEDAETSSREVLARLDELGVREGRDRVQAHQGLGAVLTRAGRAAEARAELEQASRLAANDPSVPADVGAFSECMLGVLEDSLGRYGDARKRFEKQLEILRRNPKDRQGDVPMILGNLGHIVAQAGDFGGARDFYEQAIAACVVLPHSKALSYLLSELAHLELGAGNVETGHALALRAVAAERSRPEINPAHLARALRVQGMALHLLGRPGDALPVFEETAALNRRALGDSGRALFVALESRARALAALGREAEARASFHDALTSARAWFLSATESLPEAQRLAAVWPIRKIMDGWLATSLGDPTRAGAIADEVLAWQGQVLRALSAERAWLRAHADPEVVALRSRLVRIVDELAPEQLLVGRMPSGPAVAHEASDLISERERIERELAVRVARGVTAPASARDVAAGLAPGEALVDYFVFSAVDPAAVFTRPGSQARLLAIVLLPGRAAATFDLGPLEPVRDAVAAHLTLVSRLTRSDPGAGPFVATVGAAARRAVWDPIAASIEGATRVFIVPDGFLGALPFETLPGRGEGRYLMEDLDIVYLPLAQERLRPARSPSANGALLVGGVAFGAPREGDTDQAREMRRALGLPFEPLPGTSVEVEAVAVALERSGVDRAAITRLEGAAATEAAVKEASQGKRFVHLATHGIFAPEGPTRSAGPETRVNVRAPTAIEGLAPLMRAAVALAGANEIGGRGRDDGLLTAAEAAWLDLSACELVTVSGCESGLGVARAGESMLGLRRAFHLAGARATVTALWRVGDEDAAALIAAFYDALLSKSDGKSAALRAARLAMLARNRSRHAGEGLPGTWGAFVLDGDWR